jgi:hypothetical protein
MGRYLGVCLLSILTGCHILRGIWESGGVVYHPSLQGNPQALYIFIPPAYDRYEFCKPEGWQVGEWVLYHISSEGKSHQLKIALVGMKGDTYRVEITKLHVAGVSVSVLFVGTDGSVQKAYYCEPGRALVEQELIQHPQEPKGEWPKVTQHELELAHINIGGKDVKAKITQIIRTHEDGTQEVEKVWQSDQIPKLYGGLIRQESQDSVIQLLDFGYDAVQTIELPE